MTDDDGGVATIGTASTQFGTLGPEFRVNTTTASSQELFGFTGGNSIATDSVGNFVITWSSVNQDGSGGYGVYAQRYNASGAAMGSEFQVNTFTSAEQIFSSVAMDGAGNFFITWSSVNQDGSHWGVYAQRYNASGAAMGSEFKVNTFTSGSQIYSSVAMDGAGNFVITWSSFGQDGSNWGVYAQRYNASGAAMGSEFKVNTFTSSNQIYSSVAIDGAGNFVITWSSLGQDGSDSGIYAQRYNASGAAVGSEFQVNTFTSSDQGDSSVVLDSAGNFITVWSSNGQDGSSYGIYAQRYSSGFGGAPLNLTVSNVAPSFEAGPNETLNPPVVGAFSRNGISFTDPGTLDVWSGTVNYGDGTGNQALAVNQATKTFSLGHTYSVQGNFTVTVSLKDDDSSSVVDTFQASVVLNQPPQIAVNNASVTVNEGSTVANSGSFSDPQGNATVTLSATSGTVVKNDLLGTWSWSAPTIDGPSGPMAVKITATDSFGEFGTTLFDYSVNNVAPTASLSPVSSISYGADAKLTLSNQQDVSSADTLAGFRYSYATTASGLSAVTYATASPTASHAFSGLAAGSHTVFARIIDKDNGFTDYSTVVIVNKAPLTVSADAKNKIYGSTDPVLTYTPSGTLYYGDSYSVISGIVLTTSTGSAATAGTHTISAAGGTASNYVVTHVNGSLSVAKAAALTATANNKNKVYGGADPALTYTPSGTLFYGDTYSVISGVSIATATGAGATAGTHVIDASGGTAANYEVTTVDGTLSVAKAAALTATADNKNKVYGGANPALTYTPSGTLYYGDTYSVISGVSLTTATGSAATAGTHVIDANGGSAANYQVATVDGTLTVAKAAALTATADNKNKVYGGADPILAYTPSGSLYYGDTYSVISGVSLVTAAGSAATAGTHVIDASGGVAANYEVTTVDGTLTVAKALLTITANNASRQYSDANPTFTESYAGFVYGQTLATSGVTGSPSLTTIASPSSSPGTYAIIGSQGSLSAANYTFMFVAGTLTVAREDARAYYTGLSFVTTSSSTSSTASVLLSATIKDITAVAGDPNYDSQAGDIRNARVTFINRETNAVIASNVPVNLVSSGDTKVGTATYNWSADIGSADSKAFQIGVIVTNWYTRDSASDDTIIEVVKPIPGSISGGGYLDNVASAGLYAGDVGSRTNFGLNAKFNKKLTNVQGHANIIVRSSGRVYQFKSNAVDSLNLTSLPGNVTKATFTAKANITDITNPLAPISLGGNKTLQIQMTDAGEPGSSDSISITLTDASGLLFSSRWNGTQSIEQLLGGGNLQVRQAVASSAAMGSAILAIQRDNGMLSPTNVVKPSSNFDQLLDDTLDEIESGNDQVSVRIIRESKDAIERNRDDFSMSLERVISDDDGTFDEEFLELLAMSR